MVNVVFKNLNSSDFIKEAVDTRIGHVIGLFAKLKFKKTVVTIEKINKDDNLSADYFHIHVSAESDFAGSTDVVKKHTELYEAIRLASESLFQDLQRKSKKHTLRFRKWKLLRKNKKAELSSAF